VIAEAAESLGAHAVEEEDDGDNGHLAGGLAIAGAVDEGALQGSEVGAGGKRGRDDVEALREEAVLDGVCVAFGGAGVGASAATRFRCGESTRSHWKRVAARGRRLKT